MCQNRQHWLISYGTCSTYSAILIVSPPILKVTTVIIFDITVFCSFRLRLSQYFFSNKILCEVHRSIPPDTALENGEIFEKS